MNGCGASVVDSFSSVYLLGSFLMLETALKSSSVIDGSYSMLPPPPSTSELRLLAPTVAVWAGDRDEAAP